RQRSLTQKLREEIISSHLKGLGDTIGSIIRKFKTYGTAANLPGCGRKPNISLRALSNLVRTTKRNPCVTTTLTENVCYKL
uniref:Uncharacterized protein n=1 Tax=Dicentrarchus labrax TaxID=13489 RepID=A0A8P4GBZ6_DICLA